VVAIHEDSAMRCVCVLALVLLLPGCIFAPRVHYQADNVATTPPHPTGEDDELLGVALSGGGSRASVFGAAGLEALWEHGLLDRVDYISSVSGGSIAAGYFIKARVTDEQALDDDFFDRYKASMRHNFWSAMEWRQCYKIRWLSSTRRSNSLREVLDKRFLHDLTLGDLSGKKPRLLINATVYDSGRRFVFTTMGHDEVAFDFGSVDGAVAILEDHAPAHPVTFADEDLLGAVPEDFPVSLAVAASAAVPFLMGPVTIQLETTYWHLGDGGMFDNTGIETLEQVVLRKMQVQQTPQNAVILALDSGFKTDWETLARTRKLRVQNHPNVIIDIPTARAEAYREVVLRSLQDERRPYGIDRYVMGHTAVSLDPSRLPESCSKEDGLCTDEECRKAIEDYIARIPTHLKIKPCAADLIELAAHAVVHETLADRFPAVRPCRLER